MSSIALALLVVSVGLAVQAGTTLTIGPRSLVLLRED